MIASVPSEPTSSCVRSYPTTFFTAFEQRRIVAVIQDAEHQTSGEIRVHVEGHCAGDAYVRARQVFAALGMHRTRQRNGALIYLAAAALLRERFRPAAIVGALVLNGILGVLMSSIPAYIASKRDKNFWLWWIATAAIFTVLLLVLIHNQAMSLMVYLLAIVPVASTVALLPRLRLRTAVPRLLDYADDASLDAETRTWVFQALRDITGQTLPHDAAAWRDWYSLSDGKWKPVTRDRE